MIPDHFYSISCRPDEQLVIVRILPSFLPAFQFHPVVPPSVAVTGDPEILENQQTITIASLVKLRPF
jgi:hypothetical protein